MIDEKIYFDASDAGKSQAWPYKRFVQPLDDAIANCFAKAKLEPELAYRAAIRLCSAGRDLMMRYFNDWQTNSGVEKDAVAIGEQLGEAISALELVLKNVGKGKRAVHVERMIENTRMRLEVSGVLSSNAPKEDKFSRASELYRQTKADRVKEFDISLY
jgi:hypothetical protein